ncbi:MAG: hypothetical protein WCQ99_10500, partial [Pseudomonadota bacterium]
MAKLKRRSAPGARKKNQVKIFTFAACLFLLLEFFFHAPAFAQCFISDYGELQQLPACKGWFTLNTDVVLYSENWEEAVSFSRSCTAIPGSCASARTWETTLADSAGGAYTVKQTAKMRNGKVIISLEATVAAKSPAQGLFFHIFLPVDEFSRGHYLAGGKAGILPPALLPDYHLYSDITNSFSAGMTGTGASFTAKLSAAVPVSLQDNRLWSPHYLAFIELLPPGAAAGTARAITIEVTGRGALESKPANITLDPSVTRCSILGIGGNYAFDLDSPVTAYTLNNLSPAFARTEMSLNLWEPANDNADPALTDMASLAASDMPGTELHREFLMMGELARRGIPFIKTVWELPAWMYAKQPGDPEGGYMNRIAPERWPEVLESIASYLLYARTAYQAEPDYFSFNEPDEGVRVYFTAPEHRDAIALVGERLAALGFKTRMLLGDVASPQSSLSYLDPAIADDRALQYVGAISFHSWGGASAAQYDGWRATAQALGLPLIVGEAGVDADWQRVRIATHRYAVQEMEHYAELFQYACPQAVLRWEYTEDYSLLDWGADDRLQLTERLAYQKHWTGFIPPHSQAL